MLNIIKKQFHKSNHGRVIFKNFINQKLFAKNMFGAFLIKFFILKNGFIQPFYYPNVISDKYVWPFFTQIFTNIFSNVNCGRRYRGKTPCCVLRCMFLPYYRLGLPWRYRCLRFGQSLVATRQTEIVLYGKTCAKLDKTVITGTN